MAYNVYFKHALKETVSEACYQAWKFAIQTSCSLDIFTFVVGIKYEANRFKDKTNENR